MSNTIHKHQHVFFRKVDNLLSVKMLTSICCALPTAHRLMHRVTFLILDSNITDINIHGRRIIVG